MISRFVLEMGTMWSLQFVLECDKLSFDWHPEFPCRRIMPHDHLATLIFFQEKSARRPAHRFRGLLLGTVLAVTFYSYGNTSRVVLMLCDDLMEQTTQAVINRTIGFFKPVTALTEMSTQVAAAGVLPSTTQTEWSVMRLKS